MGRVGRVSALCALLLLSGFATLKGSRYDLLAQSVRADLRLVMAAQNQERDAVRTLLAAGVDVNTPRADGSTPLLWAAHWNDLEMAKLLLHAGAKVNTAEDHGVTPLALACENGSAAMVSTLVAAGANPNAAQANGVTPLMIAARGGNVEIAQLLLARGANVKATIPSTGQTALMWATAERHIAMMRELIAAGADVHAQSTIGFTPLLFAARNGDLDAAQVLLGAGAGVNERGSDGTSALPLAIVSGHDAFASFLLEQGADANGTIHGVGALHAAAGNVDVWLRDWLRARGASVDARSTSGLEPARRVGMVKALLDRGADPNARISTSTFTGLGVAGKHGAFESFSVGTGDLRGATPLWVAAFGAGGGGGGGGGDASRTGGSPAIQILKLLLDAGADPNARTDDRTTPLMVAAGLGRASYQPGAARGARSASAEAAVKMLVEAGADVNAVNEASFTAVHGAAFRGLNEVLEYLVDRRADINARDFRGRTAYRITQGGQQGFRVQAWPDTAALLQKRGADLTLGVDGRTVEREQARKTPPPAIRH